MLLVLVLMAAPGLWVASSSSHEALPAVGGVGAPGDEGDGDTGADGRRTPWNAIVVVVDDMDDFACADAAAYLPRSAPWLVDQGRCFEDATAASPVCCPARAVISTGQLPHNNGVRRQNEAIRLVGSDTVQHDLAGAGVATYGVGKFLNGLNPGLIASGEFDSGFEEHDFWPNPSYYTYPLYDDEGEPYRPEEPVHTTVRAGEDLRGFVAEQDDERPFYAYAAFFSPHDRTGGGPRGRRLPVPTPANVGREVPPFAWQPELDTRDKLLPFRALDEGRAYFEAKQATRVRSLYDVDDQMALTFAQLEEQGLLDTTMVLFTSDNGYALGENGWHGKAVPYSASVDVPMLAYVPTAMTERGVDDRQVDLVDIAPTMYDLFGVAPGHLLDGHSLLSDYARTRGRLLSFANERSSFVLQESGYAPFRVPTWAALRTKDHLLVEFYRSGRLLEREFYADPLDHENLLWRDLPRSERAALWRRILPLVKDLRAMRTCAGTLEQGSPNPCP